MRIHHVLFASLLSLPAVAQATWSQLYPSTVPPGRREGVMAYHEASGTMLMLTGNNAGYAQDCWRLDGANWTPVAPPYPSPRVSSAMVYDSVRQRLVLFGGASQSGSLQDTWEWNGTTWSTVVLAVKPPARFGHMMAFDRQRGVTVLYGGFASPGGGSVIVGDLWEWDGVAWVERTPAVSPGPRIGSVLAFDPVRGEILLHGGSTPVASGTSPRNDTWTWNGVAWQQQFPLTPPPYRFAARAATDLHRGRIVMQGGGLDPFAWEWDGAQWSIVLQASPSDRNNHCMAYDTVGRRVVLTGGGLGTGSTVLDDTWIYRTPLPATIEVFGNGCTGSAGAPTLANVPYHLPWLGDTVTNRVDHIAAGEIGALFVSSFGSTPPIDLGLLGMTGCDLLVPLDILEFAPAVAGVADWSYTAPLSLALAGVSFRQQAFPLDAAANPFGLSASNGLRGTFGVR